MDRLYLGVEIGGSKLQIVAGKRSGKIERRWRATARRDDGRAAIARQILAGIAEIRQGIELAGIGVGFGGPVDFRSGRICRSHQVQGWENFDLRGWLAAETGLRAAVENDSNCAALAEATLGAGAGQSPVFYFNLGSGVGGGLVVDGRVYHGAPPGEAEFGHLRLDRSGVIVESRCSGWAVDRRIRAAACAHPQSCLAQAVAGADGGESRHLAAALAQGDPHAKQILIELSDDLAFALSHAIHLFHPAVLVLGGGLALVGEELRAAVAGALGRYVMEAFCPGPPLRLARLGEDAVPIGALLLVQ